MQKKIVISMAVVALLLMGIMATSVLASNVSLAKNAVASNELQAIVKTGAARKVASVRELTTVAVDADAWHQNSCLYEVCRMVVCPIEPSN